MPDPYWPLFDLRVRTPRLELRPVDQELMYALVALASAGIHDPATMPFTHPWTNEPSPGRERHSLQHYWRKWADWSPEDWHLSIAVLVDGEVVGAQDLFARQFARRRSVETGSWLGRAHQGHGLGLEMRAAVLHLAFAGLGAEAATSGAYTDNAPSVAVSRALGYADNGVDVAPRRDAVGQIRLFRLTREEWESRRRDDIEIEGLEACRELFGA